MHSSSQTVRVRAAFEGSFSLPLLGLQLLAPSQDANVSTELFGLAGARGRCRFKLGVDDEARDPGLGGI